MKDNTITLRICTDLKQQLGIKSKELGISTGELITTYIEASLTGKAITNGGIALAVKLSNAISLCEQTQCFAKNPIKLKELEDKLWASVK